MPDQIVEESILIRVQKSRTNLQQLAMLLHEKAELTGPVREQAMGGLTYVSNFLGDIEKQEHERLANE